MMGMDGAKFHDRRARQALQKAINYEGFIEAIRPLGGRYAAPVSDLLPHLQQLSQKDLQQWHRYDPKEARALWAAADFDIPVEKITVRQIGGKAFTPSICSPTSLTWPAGLWRFGRLRSGGAQHRDSGGFSIERGASCRCLEAFAVDDSTFRGCGISRRTTG